MAIWIRPPVLFARWTNKPLVCVIWAIHFHIDLQRLRIEFAKKVKHKASTLQDVRQVVEETLAQMVARNPLRMDYYKEIFRNHRRLQSRERPRHDRGDVRRAGRPRKQPERGTTPRDR